MLLPVPALLGLPPIPALMFSATMEEYNLTIVYVHAASAFTVIVPLILSLLGIKKFDKGIQRFALYLGLVLLSETSGIFLGGVLDIPNLIVYDIFTALEYVFLILVFSAWHEDKLFRTAMLASIPVFLVVWLSATFIFQTSGSFDSIFLSIESIVFVFLSVVTLAKEMRDSSVLLVDNPRFWVASGVLVYFAGNLFVFALIEQLLQPGVTRYHSAWMIHTALNVTKNILFTLGFLSTGAPSDWWSERKRKWQDQQIRLTQ
ncbi:MAG: hypothetical protein RBU27_09800 [Bacteroidota bacterium]|nr:hypothetical protein [Bacteroidota bacterium]